MGAQYKLIRRLISLAACLAIGWMTSAPNASAQSQNPPVFQLEIFPNEHDRPAIDDIEFDVRMGIRTFKIDVNSIFPWICEGAIHNVYADGRALASSGNTWYLRNNFNVYSATVRYYVPSNKGYCSFIIRGYQ